MKEMTNHISRFTMLNYFEEKSSLMNGAQIRGFAFLIRKEKMEKTKKRKEVNVELFIAE